MSRLALVIAAVLAFAPHAEANVRTQPQTQSKAAPKAPTALSLIVEYQRVGRDLLALQDQRGRFDISDLMPRFRAIKIDQDTSTPAGRITTAATLADIAAKIERLRGVTVQRACLDNPLAAGCS